MTRRGRKNEDIPRIGKRGAYELFKQTKIDNGFYDIHVQAPPGVCQSLLGATSYLANLLRLIGVGHTPTVRSNGPLLTAPGCDDATRLPDPPVIDIPDKPTNNELAAAVEMRSDFATQV